MPAISISDDEAGNRTGKGFIRADHEEFFPIGVIRVSSWMDLIATHRRAAGAAHHAR